MRYRVQVLLIVAMAALPLSGADAYTFHVSMSTVAEGLRAVNPESPALSCAPAERLAEAAMLFEKRSGAGWRATFVGCPKALTMLGCEVRVNSHAVSSAPRDRELEPLEQHRFDLGFSANADGSVSTRCLRTSCRIGVVNAPRGELEVVLAFGESKDLPLDSDLAVTFPPR